MSVVIHHHPDCGKSRNALAIADVSGKTPIIFDYLEAGWTGPPHLALFAAAELTPRTALRRMKPPAEGFGLLDPSVSEDATLAAMLDHPIQVNRPIICTPRGVHLCRPSETVFNLLDYLPPGPLEKDYGTPLIDAEGNRPA